MKLDERSVRLVAIGASITANCFPCLEHHVKEALARGLAAEDIAAAIEVGRMVRKGAASNIDKFAASLNQAVPAGAGEIGEACGCAT